MLPLSLSGADATERAQLTYRAADGREHVYLGDYDSYYWLRAARTYLEKGTVCDSFVGGQCHDDAMLAPVGTAVTYRHSVHVLTIAWTQRVMNWLEPGYPLASSAFLVPVIIGLLGIFPAFAIGRRLAGPVGGFAAAVAVSLNPLFLQRSIGSDNDVWNVVLPLFLVWAAIRASDATTSSRQVGYALLGLAFVGIHALTWKGWLFTYVVVVGGLSVHLLASLLRGALRDRDALWKSEIRRALVALACFTAVPLALALPAGKGPTIVAKLGHLWTAISAGGWAPVPGFGGQFPDPLSTVGELTHTNLPMLGGSMAGVPVFFAGWLGLLLLLLPRRNWQWWHFAILIAGNYIFAFLLTRSSVSLPLLIGVLSLPLIAAAMGSAVDRSGGAEAGEAAPLLVIGWFLAAFVLSLSVIRFALLLVAPFGIAFGVALGRLSEWLVRVRPRTGLPQQLTAAFALLPCLLLYLPVRAGYDFAAGARPRMNDAWWDTFGTIRRETPPQTIVTTWWPYGYWAEYGTARRTTADGGTLSTHVPYWLAQALFAPGEDEALGLLRMLDCGSEATPHEEKDRGAYRRLILGGADEVSAQQMVFVLARTPSDEVPAYLQTHHIAESSWKGILRATHCKPPPGVLILSTEMVGVPGWKFLGSWNFRNAYAAGKLRSLPGAKAVHRISTRLDLAPNEARALLGRAAAVRGDAAVGSFVAPRETYLTRDWSECQAVAGTADLVCPLNLRLPSGDRFLESFTYSRDAPLQGVFRWRGLRDPQTSLGKAASTLVATSDRLESFDAASPIDERLGVLIDVPNDRVLVGTPALLRSTFTQLLFLDGRYARRFSKLDEHIGYRGERVVTWKIDWTPPPRP